MTNDNLLAIKKKKIKIKSLFLSFSANPIHRATINMLA